MELLEEILSRENLNLAYKRVVSNGGTSGVDGMSVEELLGYLKQNKENLLKEYTHSKIQGTAS